MTKTRGAAGQAESEIKQALMFIPNLLRLVYRLLQDERVAKTDKALLVAAIAYVISPWDFLPDFMPFLGQVDDLLLLALVLRRLLEGVDREVIEQHWDGSAGLLDLVEKILNYATFYLPPGIVRKIVNKTGSEPYAEDYYKTDRHRETE